MGLHKAVRLQAALFLKLPNILQEVNFRKLQQRCTSLAGWILDNVIQHAARRVTVQCAYPELPVFSMSSILLLPYTLTGA